MSWLLNFKQFLKRWVLRAKNNQSDSDSLCMLTGCFVSRSIYYWGWVLCLPFAFVYITVGITVLLSIFRVCGRFLFVIQIKKIIDSYDLRGWLGVTKLGIYQSTPVSLSVYQTSHLSMSIYLSIHHVIYITACQCSAQNSITRQLRNLRNDDTLRSTVKKPCGRHHTSLYIYRPVH